MLSSTQSTLKGRSPESTPQTLAGKGCFNRGLPRLSKVCAPTFSPLTANKSSMQRSRLDSGSSFRVMGTAVDELLSSLHLYCAYCSAVVVVIASGVSADFHGRILPI